MPRKPKKGYFVRGKFVAEGSELDLELKRELKGNISASKTDLKRASIELQTLGEALLTLRADLLQTLGLGEKLCEALEQARRITNFEGRRRQLQFVGKLMRGLDAPALEAARGALNAQQHPPAQETALLHEAEHWRCRIVAQDDALGAWIEAHPDTDVQQLRALVRQARKDLRAGASGAAVRQGKAYREVFRIVRAQLQLRDAAGQVSPRIESSREQEP